MVASHPVSILDDEDARPPHRRVGAWLLGEFKHVLPPTIFFAIGFNLIVLTQRLLVGEYLAHLASFLLATTAALVVGKSVLVADKLPFLRRFDNAPLIRPILFKTFVYWLVVFIARLLEAYVHYVFQGWQFGGFLEELVGTFSLHRFIAIQLWILVLFLIYVTAAEISALFGNGEVLRLLFNRYSSQHRQTRRERVRTLVRLSRLTQRHSIEELSDPRSVAYREVATLIRQLAEDTNLRARP